ncbi:MAG: pectate lyase [Planctomycetota bacterium]|jgi:hypothetical protein
MRQLNFRATVCLISLFMLQTALSRSADGADPVSHDNARRALAKAVRFFQGDVSASGAYLWQYSADLKLREGEGVATVTQAWVQPPGTPTVGDALLEAYLVSREPVLLDAATAAGHALVKGQLVSGGWDYRIEFDPSKRSGWQFLVDVKAGEKRSSKARNVTTLDDDNTQSALRFLMKLDTVLNHRDRAIHSCVEYALASLLKAQSPNGAWPQRFSEPPNPDDFPVLKASYPETWPREYPRLDYRSYYTFNDNTIADVIDTMFLAADLYDAPQYAAAAERAGDFIILAQMPEPQPVWAQQYNAKMQPAWARRFEPTSVTGGESQGVIRTLISLYRQTGKQKYLDPVPRALDYLERSELPNGQLARFYELKTNRPLYFTKQYELTYDDSDMPTHYGFKVGSGVDRLRRDYQQARNQPRDTSPLWKTTRGKPGNSSSLRNEVRKLVDSIDRRGAWIESGRLKAARDDTPREIITTKTFVKNIRTLSRYIAATKR